MPREHLIAERQAERITGYASNAELPDLALIESARAGDTDAFALLYRRYSPRLFGIAARYFAPGLDRDDLMQEATIGFFKAVRDYKSDRGEFVGFAELCVRRQVITLIKTATRQKHSTLNRAVSIDARLYVDSDDTLLDRLSAPVEFSIEELSEVTTFLDALLLRCSDLERGILSLYAKGYTFAEMAWELGVRWKSIDNAVWRVKVKARKLLNDRGYRSLASRYGSGESNVS